jgi:adenine-specific DNA methylase
VSLERDFIVSFAAELALKEKQIQQNYRPIIGIHKWFARRPGTVFRNLLLAEYDRSRPAEESYFRAHRFSGVIADPFAGGGTPTYEANRLGFSVVAADVNPMAYWIVRQGLEPLDLVEFRSGAETIIARIEREIAGAYRTSCVSCGEEAPVKYFLWVKVQPCSVCGADNDLFPGYLLAEDERHPLNVLACSACGELNEYKKVPNAIAPGLCRACGASVRVEGNARRNKARCHACKSQFQYPPLAPAGPPRHRMWAIEYQCPECKPSHEGRFFKRPDGQDLARFRAAATRLDAEREHLLLPADPVPDGDETKRLHRWGYKQFVEMFNERQLLGLGLLLRHIREVTSPPVRHALLTVFSDFLRYQNMLCRYDTYALKCQDVFSIHGFPVGLVQCENSLLGIPKVGSGSFRHFVEKYVRAKEYCLRPFETIQQGSRKIIKYVDGERIEAPLVDHFPRRDAREALIVAGPATSVELPADSLDGVFTDPPYYDAVQYAELMDFCYAWLRIGLADDVPAFRRPTSRHTDELTGNDTMGRDLAHFAAGLSQVFQHYAQALKPGAPFVFTYHHNDPVAYAPVVLAILDAGLDCTAALPVPAEMGASLHIAGTNSSVLDSVFVCRRSPVEVTAESVQEAVSRDVRLLREGGARVTLGDIRCLTSGHIAKVTVNELRADWSASAPLQDRLTRVRTTLKSADVGVPPVISPGAT